MSLNEIFLKYQNFTRFFKLLKKLIKMSRHYKTLPKSQFFTKLKKKKNELKVSENSSKYKSLFILPFNQNNLTIFYKYKQTFKLIRENA